MADKPVAEWNLWDVLERPVVSSRAKKAPKFALLRDLASEEEMFGAVAKSIIDGISDGSDESRFLNFCRRYIGKSVNDNEYNAVDQLAEIFGADFKRLKKYLAFKNVIRQSLRRPGETRET